MTRTLTEQLDRRPIDEQVVEQIAEHMRKRVRAARLRELRDEQHITQKELANQLNVSQNRVSQIEIGEVDKAQVDTLRRYVEALGGTLTLEASFGDTRYLIG
ncbi:helix-turn-helix domain-containing protein [Propionimicrobium sp. PCR01-08-3]|uniref:helix-turn-helix domain-containing protein n=1 Tax=Propionimicrobium sp. PCR01-08-3 TaxID=3052086 RepID=UPI00255C537F|nr:helix-turn-helix domain-containing protein [Propionimicrobium sp. PCR01-08-3]WIY82520.1 XRE family transcriptional regulator [Propionimicrobium sp. PCR01-08-3]